MSESGTAAGEPGPALLAVEGVTKEFGLRRTVAERIARTRAESHRAVDDVSFSLRKGEILGLAGGSGSGKTTLARCLIRLVEPGAGSVALDGIDARAARGSAARAAPPDAWSSRIPTRR